MRGQSGAIHHIQSRIALIDWLILETFDGVPVAFEVLDVLVMLTI